MTPTLMCAVTNDDQSLPMEVGVRETIDVPERIREVVRGLVGNSSEGFVRHGRSRVGRVRAVALDHDPEGVRWDLGGFRVNPPFVLELMGYNSVFQVPVTEATVCDRLLSTPLPAMIMRLRHRWFRRASVPVGWTVSFQHPPRPSVVRCVLRDVSYSGLSFWAEPHADRVYPGLSLDEFEVAADNGTPLRLRGEVRFVTHGARLQPALCGMRIHPQGATEEARWHDLVTQCLHPTTRSHHRWSEACWELYEKCGYFRLSDKTPAFFAPLKQAYLRTSQQLSETPDIGCHAVWPVSAKDLQAAGSVLKVYHGSWFGFQMAKIPGNTPDGVPAGRVLRDMHQRAYETAQLDPDLRWLIAYCQDKEIWSRLAHRDLPARYAPSERACVVRFRALEVPCAGPSQPLPEGLEISPAKPAEIGGLLRFLARSRPRPYVEALDLVPERFDLASIKAIWGRAGLARERAVLIARRDQQPLAAAVVEAAEDGLHLFHLLDAVRLYPLAPGGEASFCCLLKEARSWYLRKGKEVFVCLLEGDTLLPTDLLEGLRDLGLADMSILSAELLPELLEHIHAITVPRDKSRFTA